MKYALAWLALAGIAAPAWAQTSSLRPTLEVPRNGEVLTSPVREMRWRRVPGAVGYKAVGIPTADNASVPRTFSGDDTTLAVLPAQGYITVWVQAVGPDGNDLGELATAVATVRIPQLQARARFDSPTYDRLVLDWDAVPEADGYFLLASINGKERRFTTSELRLEVGKVYSASWYIQAGFGSCVPCSTDNNRAYNLLDAPFYAVSEQRLQSAVPGDPSVSVPQASRLAEAWNVPVAPGAARVSWSPIQGASAYHVVLLQRRSNAADAVLADREVADPAVTFDLPANASLSVLVRAVVNGSYGRYDSQSFQTGSPVAAEAVEPGGAEVRVLQNPVMDRLAVTYRATTPSRFALYDMLGRAVWRTDVEAGTGRVEMDRGALPSGVYVLRVAQGEAVTTRTVVFR